MHHVKTILLSGVGALRKLIACLRLFFILPIRFYQLVISPLLPPACRFYPTCSAYAMEAILRHGLVRGSWLTLKRLARCHPWGGSGYDPVPQVQQTRRVK